MWVLAQYEPTALFALKPATATASGAKSLLVPTPYSVKMALLDVACRLEGKSAAEAAWPWLRQVGVALQPTKQVVVNNTFTKVLKPRRSPSKPGSQDAGYFGRTIAYREYVYLHDPFVLALEGETDEQAAYLERWLININYLGKRGSFIQLVELPRRSAELPSEFIRLDTDVEVFTLSDVILAQLDDVGANTTFERISIYSPESMKLGVHRLLRHVALPYRRVASSRSYTQYERSDQ